jgi:actin-related protein
MYLPTDQKDYHPPIILELGNLTMRAGYAGEDMPEIMQESLLGCRDEEIEATKKIFRTKYLRAA